MQTNAAVQSPRFAAHTAGGFDTSTLMLCEHAAVDRLYEQCRKQFASERALVAEFAQVVKTERHPEDALTEKLYTEVCKVSGLIDVYATRAALQMVARRIAGEWIRAGATTLGTGSQQQMLS